MTDVAYSASRNGYNGAVFTWIGLILTPMASMSLVINIERGQPKTEKKKKIVTATKITFITSVNGG